MTHLHVISDDERNETEFSVPQVPHPERAAARHATDQRSNPERFLDSFLHEGSIRWLLVVGAAIVFGSSLMLVTKAWPSWSPAPKFLAILAYTAATYAAAEIGRRNLGLQVTYKVLYGLTLLLLPICFMALKWFAAGTNSQQTLQTIEVAGLLLPATWFLWIASQQILDHILRGRQATFLNCYRLLCLAGVLPACTESATAFGCILFCWVVFTAGVVKVNRHTFWLAEEHALPWIFGFLPILMLGLQFIILIGTKAVAAVPVQWLGLCCVLVSSTILITSRAVADVFRQRTGNLVRPLPWNVATPLTSGLILTILGVAISFIGFRYVGTTTYAVIPTAALAAGVMWMTAKDFRYAGLVWVSLIFAAICYQCSPTLLSNIVQAIKTGAASALREDRLPVAFYGLTYVPFMAAAAFVSRHLRLQDDLTLSRPFKHFVTLLSALLFLLSMTHLKAVFMVGVINIPLFLMLAILFGDRRYVVPSLLALVIATATAISATSAMGLSNIESAFAPVMLAGLAVMMTSSQTPDRLLNRIAASNHSVFRHRDAQTGELTHRSLILHQADGTDRSLFQLTGCLLGVVMSVHWLVTVGLFSSTPLTDAAMLQYGFLMLALLLYGLRTRRYLGGLSFWLLLAIGAMRAALATDLTTVQIANAGSMAAAAVSLLTYACLKFSRTRSALMNDDSSATDILQTRSVPIAFLAPLCDLSIAILTGLAVVYHLPVVFQTHSAFVSGTPMPQLSSATGITVVWLAVATLLFRSRVAGMAATIAIPAWTTAVLISSEVLVNGVWLPVVWALMFGATLIACSLSSTSRTLSTKTTAIRGVLSSISNFCVMAIVILTCLSLEIPLRIAGAIGIVAIAIADRSHLRDTSRFTWLAVITNLHALLLVAATVGCYGSILTLGRSLTPQGLPLLFLTGVLSIAIFDRRWTSLDETVCRSWSAFLRAGMVPLAAMSIIVPILPPTLQLLMTIGFSTAVLSEVFQAVRRNEEVHVWCSLAIAATGVCFLSAQQIFNFGSGTSQFVFLAISIASLTISKMAKTRPGLRILQRPLYEVGQTLPALVTVMAVYRHTPLTSTLMASGNTLALLFAAGIYFQQAMVTRRRRFAILAVNIVNLALMLLWRSMQLTQAEFYLVPVGLSILAFVELLNRELPRKTHDPLRYLGALTILVSPMFEILDGSWGHVVSLMLLCVMVILLSIGLRLKSLVYTGSAFLMADLIVMVVRSHEEYPFLPWLCGILLGIAVIAFAAFCENHRDHVRARIRMVSTQLSTWR